MKKQWKSLISIVTALVIFVTGIPVFPGDSIPHAYADTSMRLDSDKSEIAAVYGGTVTVGFRYDDPDGQTEHNTVITLEKNGVTLRTLSSGSYPTETWNSVTWDGKINGTYALDGVYTIRVTPTKFADHGGSFDVTVKNPNPPKPKPMHILPDTTKDSHVIRGLAEAGTEVTLFMTLTERIGREQVTHNEKLVLKSGIPVKKQRTWSAGQPVEAAYFENFPDEPGNRPEDYIGEWETEVTLPADQIAQITAVSIRKEGNVEKTSLESEMLRVLRHKTKTWGTKWAVLAAYYYNLFGVQRDDNANWWEILNNQIRDIASFNEIPLEVCHEGESCYDPIPKDMNLLLLDPVMAGDILEDDEDWIEEAYASKAGHPLAEDFDPVNLATGDFGFHHTNLSLNARFPLDFTVTYRSRDHYDGDIGVGWHHSFERHLEFRDQGLIYVVTPEGASLPYIPAGDTGHYAIPAGVYNTLTRQTDGSFIEETPDKTQYIYRKDGLLYRITDPNGNALHFRYRGTVLEKVSTDGAEISFTFGKGGKIVNATDHTGRSVLYDYDSATHDLTSITLPDGAVIRFGYDDKHRLTSIRNPNETAELINVYDD